MSFFFFLNIWPEQSKECRVKWSGWGDLTKCLHKNSDRQAMNHFIRSLAFDPCVIITPLDPVIYITNATLKKFITTSKSDVRGQSEQIQLCRDQPQSQNTLIIYKEIMWGEKQAEKTHCFEKAGTQHWRRKIAYLCIFLHLLRNKQCLIFMVVSF